MVTVGLSGAEKKLVIWDFDGVLCDSLRECFNVVALAAARNVGEDFGQHARSQIEQICSVDAIDAIDSWMRQLRPFIVTGQDYLWQYFNKPLFNRPFSSMDEYREVYDQVYDASIDAEYKALFYESRRLLGRTLGNKYLGLFSMHPGAVHALRMSLEKHETYICTARDRSAFEVTLEQHGLSVPRERIYSQDYCGELQNNGTPKSRQILEILEANGGIHAKFLLVEDQVKAPEALSAVCCNMRVVFAAYGYGLVSDWENARLNAVVRIDDPADLIYEIY